MHRQDSVLYYCSQACMVFHKFKPAQFLMNDVAADIPAALILIW